MAYKFDNISKFFEDLLNGKNAKVNMLRVYGAYECECERVKREREIEEQYRHTGCSYVVHLVNDEIAIVEENEKGEITGYFAHVGNKKSSYIWPSFEMALLCAINIKLTGREDATEWMWKLVGGENNP